MHSARKPPPMRRYPRHPAVGSRLHTFTPHCRRHGNAFYGSKNLGIRLVQGGEGEGLDRFFK